MNFKYFIIAIYLLFVTLIMFMVFKSCGQKIELETKDYYAKELRYQEEIDALNMGNAYADSFEVQKLGQVLRIVQPGSLQADSFLLEFIKPDNAASDKRIHTVGSLIPEMQLNGFDRGMYGLKIRAYKAGNMYLIEKKIKL